MCWPCGWCVGGGQSLSPFFLEIIVTMQNSAKRSAASIKIIKRDPSDLIGGLRAMLDRLGPEVNKHDRADILIKALHRRGREYGIANLRDCGTAWL